VLARILPEEKRVGAEIVALRKARAVGRALGDKAQSLRLDRQKYLGNDPGPVEWSSRLEQRGDYRWFLPRVELVGKLGQAGGPSLEQVPPESPASPPPARPASRRRLERGRR